MSGDSKAAQKADPWTHVLLSTPNFEVWATRAPEDQVRVTVSLDHGSHIVWQEFWPRAEFDASPSEDVVAHVLERCWPSIPPES